MFSVMLFTALTVMYTVDSLFLRMFLFLCPTPCIYSCPLTDYIEQQAPSGGAKVIDGLGSLTDQNQGNYAYGFRKAFLET